MQKRNIKISLVLKGLIMQLLAPWNENFLTFVLNNVHEKKKIIIMNDDMFVRNICVALTTSL